jgi:hypothetical protein
MGGIKMDTNLFSSYFLLAFVFSIISLMLCITQIVLREKINLLSICKISTLFPLMIIIINTMMGWAHGFYDGTKGADLSTRTIYIGLSTTLHSIALVLILTIIILIVYAITKTVYVNTVEKKN